MKVVCESCHAKYQVPDARVAGKKLKIRCKRCGETVLIRGDLELAAAADDGGATTVAPSASITGGFSPGVEWHVSVDGQVSGPFSMPDLLNWLATSTAGWDAYVWREGFGEWIEARACDAIVTAAGGAPSSAVAATGTDDEHPTQMFQGPEAFAQREVRVESLPPAQPRPTSIAPSAASAVQSSRARASVAPAVPAVASQPPRTASGTGSLPSVRSPSRAPGSLPPARAPGSLPPARSPSRAPGSLPPRAAASSPQLRAAAPAGTQGEDSVLFSTQNLHQVALSGSQPPGYVAAARPGYAAGEGSGLVDIRALAQLARQVQSVPPRGVAADGGRFSMGEDESALIRSHAGSFAHVDSLSPVTPIPCAKSSGNGLAYAVLGGFALVAASAFAAIMITRTPVATSANVQPQAPAAQPVIVASAAQPAAPATPEPAAAEPAPTAAPAAPEPSEPEAKAEEPAVEEPAAEEPAAPAVQTASAKRATRQKARGARTAADDKKAPPAPEPKSKSKDKDKALPPSLEDVMLADSSDAKAKAEEKAEPAPAPEPETKSTSADLDDLLGAKPAKEPAKPRSIDDLLDGAVEKKPAAAAVDSMAESPSREQTLSAMRGVESSVRACAQAEGMTGTALVAVEVSGATGRVESADVSGVEGPLAACIAKAARGAKFPRFSKPTFSVKYPYRFK